MVVERNYTCSKTSKQFLVHCISEVAPVPNHSNIITFLPLQYISCLQRDRSFLFLLAQQLLPVRSTNKAQTGSSSSLDITRSAGELQKLARRWTRRDITYKLNKIKIKKRNSTESWFSYILRQGNMVPWFYGYCHENTLCLK